MNFARTNLSLLLARQNRQAAQRGAVAACRTALPQVATRVTAPRCAVIVPAVSDAAPNTPTSAREALELACALAMMAAFMVLALFG